MTNAAYKAWELLEGRFIMDERKACPFCGENNSIICTTVYLANTPNERLAYAVSCRTIDCHGVVYQLGYGLFATAEEAVAAWNTRALSPIQRRMQSGGPK